MQLTVDPEPHRFEIAVVTASTPTVSMTVRGDIDLATAPLLLSALLDAIESNTPRVLELDLTGMTFLDARGVSALLQAYLAAAAIDCRVRLVRPPGHIRRVLDITGVSSVCELVD
jgi:anti-sigma B factor antagonist